MILTDAQLKEILLVNPTGALWKAADADRKRLQMHVLGIDVQKNVVRIEGFESVKAETVRKKYMKTNRDLFARLLRPVDNIWNGRGGGSFYNTTEPNQKKIRQMVLNVTKGYSLRKWVEKFWRPRYIDDPQGIILMEVDQRNPNGTYPTYKSSKDIYDALPNGRRLEYLVLRTNDPGVFRVIDDVSDRLVKIEGADTVTNVTNLKDDPRKIKVLGGKKYPVYVNWFGQVPALIISDLPKDGDENRFMSPVQDEVELADVYLRDGSIANVYRFRQGFPKTWKYPEVCGTCKGTKVIDTQVCKDCQGSGIKLLSNPEDVMVLSWPNKEEPEISEKGGFISPDIKYLEYADKSQAILEELITRTHWGTDRETKVDEKSGEKTATQSFIDTQPVNNRLTGYAEAAESVEKFIIDHIGEFNFEAAYNGSAVNLGRRFLIESVDKIWTKYIDSRKGGAPQATLDDLLRDYYETKYQGNGMELSKYLKLAKLEPGVHLSMSEAKSNLPFLDFMKKVYCTEYASTLTDLDIINRPIEKLRTDLEAFTQEKIDNLVEDPAVVAERAAKAGEDPAGAPGGGKKPPKKKPVPAG